MVSHNLLAQANARKQQEKFASKLFQPLPKRLLASFTCLLVAAGFGSSMVIYGSQQQGRLVSQTAVFQAWDSMTSDLSALFVSKDVLASSYQATIPPKALAMSEKGRVLAAKTLKPVAPAAVPATAGRTIIRTENINLAQLQSIVDARLSDWQALGRFKGDKGDQGPAGYSPIFMVPSNPTANFTGSTMLSATELSGKNVTADKLIITDTVTAKDATFTGTVAMSNAVVANLTMTGNQTIAANAGTVFSSEDFENGSLSSGWTTGGDASWTAASSTAQEGSYSMASGPIEGYQDSYVEVTRTFSTPGYVKFYWKVSSEAGYDGLFFCMDLGLCDMDFGRYTQKISGEVGWAEVVWPVSAGSHTFRWAYLKDYSASAGSDRGWLDNVRFINGYSGNLTVGNNLNVAGQLVLGSSSGIAKLEINPESRNGIYVGSISAGQQKGIVLNVDASTDGVENYGMYNTVDLGNTTQTSGNRTGYAIYNLLKNRASGDEGGNFYNNLYGIYNSFDMATNATSSRTVTGIYNSAGSIHNNASVFGIRNYLHGTGDNASVIGSFNVINSFGAAATGKGVYGTYTLSNSDSKAQTVYGSQWDLTAMGANDIFYGYYINDNMGWNTGYLSGGTAYGFYSNISAAKLQNTSYSIFVATTSAKSFFGSNVGIGSTTPGVKLAVVGTAGKNDILDIASSSSASFLRVTASGRVGINTTTPTAQLAIQGASIAPTVPLLTIASSSGSNLLTVRASGDMIFGGTEPLWVTKYSFYDPYVGGESHHGAEFYSNITNTATNNSQYYYGLIAGAYINQANQNAIPSLYGIAPYATNDGSGNVGEIYGSNLTVGNAGKGTVGDMIGSYLQLYADNWSGDAPGTVTNAYGSFTNIYVGHGGKINNVYHYYMSSTRKSTGGGYVGNNYGLYIENQNAGSLLNYAIYTNQAASSTNPTSSFALYNSGTAPSYFAGNIGIGTTTPSYLLHVYRSTDGDVAAFRDANGTCTINPTNTALVCSSDARLKRDVTDMQSVLEKLAKVRPVDFKWLNQSDDTAHFGFIAQELEGLFPEMVATNPDGYKSVAYSNFVPVLTKAIQEQQEMIQALTLQVQGTGENAESGNLAVADIAFKGNLAVKGHLYLSSDSVGQAKILAGQTAVRVAFARPYQYQPIVTVTPRGQAVLSSEFKYTVTDENSEGFTIQINQPLATELEFNWHAFASETAKLAVSDGTTLDILMVVPSNSPAAEPSEGSQPPVPEGKEAAEETTAPPQEDAADPDGKNGPLKEQGLNSEPKKEKDNTPGNPKGQEAPPQGPQQAPAPGPLPAENE